MKTCIFLANGFEEMEAIGVIDVLRRGDILVDVVSIEESLEVRSGRNVGLRCDYKFLDLEFSEYDMLIFPGGLQGVNRIRNFPLIYKVIEYFHLNNKYIAAICAAPLILSEANILECVNYTCYKGIEKNISKGNYIGGNVVVDKNIITSSCVGYVFDFAYELLKLLKGDELKNKIFGEMFV